MPWEATGKAAGPVPHPIFDVGDDIQAETPPDVAGFANGVLSVLSTGTSRASSLVFDLDKDAQKAKSVAEIEKKAKAGTFAGEFAWVQRGRHEWFLYDTNHDGKWDTVLFRADGVNSASKLNEKGGWTPAPDLAKGSLVQPDLFTDAKHKAALAALGPLYFNGDTLIP